MQFALENFRIKMLQWLYQNEMRSIIEMLIEITLTFFLKLLTFKSYFSTVLNLELC